MNKKIVLYGTGLRGEKFYCRNLDKYEIAYCIDRKAGRMFHGLEVYLLEEKVRELQSSFIVVAAEYGAYKEIKKSLVDYELQEGVDYIWDSYLDRELAVL